MRVGPRLAWLLLPLFFWGEGAWPATFTFSYVDNREADFASRGWLAPDSAFRRSLKKVGELWGVRIASNANFSVVVVADRTARRAGGTFSYGRTTGVAADGSLIWEPGPLTKVITGSNPGERAYGYDIELVLDPVFADQYYWVNTDPETQTVPAPPGKTDLIWIFLHEMGHALGLAGTWSTASQTRGQYLSTFDAYLYFGGNGAVMDGSGRPNAAYFLGPETTLAAGEPPQISHVGVSNPLYTQDFYHLGTCGSQPVYTQSLMNGCQTLRRPNNEITGIDVALLADLGYAANSVYYPDSGEVRLAVRIPDAQGVPRMVAGVLKIVDPVSLVLELTGFSESRRQATDATYDPATGNIAMSSMVVGTTRYSVELSLISTNPLRWRVGRISGP